MGCAHIKTVILDNLAKIELMIPNRRVVCEKEVEPIKKCIYIFFYCKGVVESCDVLYTNHLGYVELLKIVDSL